MELIDNISQLLGDDLRKTLTARAKFKIAASCFSIYAFEALKAELERVESLEFIFTKPTFVPGEATDPVRKERREFHIPKTERERSFYGTEFEIQLKNKLTQRAIAKECADWMRRKARFRSNRGKAPMQQFACVNSQTVNTVYLPLHGFTAVDLGYQRGDAVSNIVNKFDEPANTAVFLSLFDQIWNDSEKLEDVTERLCEHIASVYQENSPERIYFLMLYNIFSEFLENLSEDVLPNDLTGYQDSLIWQKLYNFQRDAATGIINKLETYNGCILADSVGLGKTFTALAVIKYYELRNRSILVLCPKKLADNWLTYNRNLKTNIFARDRFNYDVLCHTDLQRTSGESYGTALNRVNWGNYDLVVIDESHNFRNNEAFKEREIREAIRAHFEREQLLFRQGIKVLSLFFIDEVAKYRQYDENGEKPGEYAQIFEEEYQAQLKEALTLFGDEYDRYLKGIPVKKTHNGYFSIDKKTNRLVDPDFKTRGETAGETDDVDAYDLILKDKERLLSFEEPVRFIFSHSALREGWDNPNVFVICTLKHSDNTISRRQEVGRGMRLCVNQRGERMDEPATVHQTNVLTVVASESYKDFVSGLQRDISESLSARPRVADAKYFEGKVIKTPTGGEATITSQMAKQIYQYLVKNDYVDSDDHITPKYHEDKERGKVAALPEPLAAQTEQIGKIIDSVFSTAQLPSIVDDRRAKSNPLSSNFQKKEFQELWNKINRKAAYTVHFDSDELIRKCIYSLDRDLKVTQLQYTVQRGSQKESASFEELKSGDAFELKESSTNTHNASIHSAVEYDLVGRLAEETKLTRRTVATILQGLAAPTFDQYKLNPEDFMAKTARLINEQKATVIVEHLTYDTIEERYESDIFTREKPKEDFSKALQVNRHIYEYVFTDSQTERDFVTELDASVEVVLYAKLPKSFFIPTPVGNYSPDWAIAFEANKVKHVFFIAETKGSLSSLDLRGIEEAKIACARRFFSKLTSDQVRYDVVNNYGKLMELVK